jgi:outer membrane protein assembly factor BamB
LAILELKPVWRRPIGNVGIHSAVKASPVVDSSGVYVGSDSSWFFKFSHDGEPRWRFRPGPADRGIHATAALDDERVYVGTYTGDIYALEKETGRFVWMMDVGDTLGASFLMLDDSLIANVETFQPNGFLAKIGRANGEVRWVSDLVGEQGHASPALHRRSDMLFAGFNNFDLVGFQATTGAIVWRKKALNYIKSTPLIWEDLVIYSASDGWLRAAAVADGHEVWASSLTESPFLASPSYEPTTSTLILQSTKGELFGVDPRDGRKKWQRQLNGSIRLAGSALVVPTPTGHVALLGCGPTELCAFTGDGIETKRWTMGGRVSSQPARFGDSLYVTEEARNGESGHLVKLGPAP